MTRKLLSQRVAVTGATGFIGMHLLNGLQAAGASIIAITAAARHPERLDSLPFPVERIVVDDITRIREAIQKANVQYVIHLGAFVSTERTIHSIEETLHQNLLPTIALLTAAAEGKVDRVVLMGSCEEYSQQTSPFDVKLATGPSSPYGASKAAATAYARMFTTTFGLSTIVLRPSVVYGPGQPDRMLISQVMKALSERSSIAVTGGRQTRDFIFVTDLVDAIIQSLTVSPLEGDVWNVGSGEVVTVRDCLERIERVTGRTGLIEYGKRPYSENEIYRYELKVQDTYNAFNWKPSTMLDEGLLKTWDYLIDHADHRSNRIV